MHTHTHKISGDTCHRDAYTQVLDDFVIAVSSVHATFPGPPCPHPVATCRPTLAGKPLSAHDMTNAMPFAHVSLWLSPSTERTDDKDLLTPHTETSRASRALARLFASPLCTMLGGAVEPSCYDSSNSSLGGGSEWGTYLTYDNDNDNGGGVGNGDKNSADAAEVAPCILVCVSLLKHSRARARHDDSSIHSVPPSPGSRRSASSRNIKRSSSAGASPLPPFPFPHPPLLVSHIARNHPYIHTGMRVAFSAHYMPR